MNGFRVIRRSLTYLFMVVISFLSVFPFIWMIIGATNSSNDIIKGKMSFGHQLIVNFQKLNELFDIGLILWNTSKIAIIGSILTLLISSMAGYSFEIFRSRVKEKIYQGLLLTMMIPFAATMIPLFTLLATFGFINSHLAVILPGITSVYLIFYFRQSTKAFPADLRDAARVDGLKEWKIFLFIYIPVMRSTYAAAFIIVFMSAWNSYILPLLVLQSNEQKTFTLVISSLGSAYLPDFGIIMLVTVIATAPMLLVFFAMQKQFVQGMLGSVK